MNKIEWLVNKDFEKDKLFIPGSIEIKKLITDKSPNIFFNILNKTSLIFKSLLFFL